MGLGGCSLFIVIHLFVYVYLVVSIVMMCVCPFFIIYDVRRVFPFLFVNICLLFSLRILILLVRFVFVVFLGKGDGGEELKWRSH